MTFSKGENMRFTYHFKYIGAFIATFFNCSLASAGGSNITLEQSDLILTDFEEVQVNIISSNQYDEYASLFYKREGSSVTQLVFSPSEGQPPAPYKAVYNKNYDVPNRLKSVSYSFPNRSGTYGFKVVPYPLYLSPATCELELDTFMYNESTFVKRNYQCCIKYRNELTGRFSATTNYPILKRVYDININKEPYRQCDAPAPKYRTNVIVKQGQLEDSPAWNHNGWWKMGPYISSYYYGGSPAQGHIHYMRPGVGAEQEFVYASGYNQNKCGITLNPNVSGLNDIVKLHNVDNNPRNCCLNRAVVKDDDGIYNEIEVLLDNPANTDGTCASNMVDQSNTQVKVISASGRNIQYYQSWIDYAWGDTGKYLIRTGDVPGSIGFDLLAPTTGGTRKYLNEPYGETLRYQIPCEFNINPRATKLKDLYIPIQYSVCCLASAKAATTISRLNELTVYLDLPAGPDGRTCK